LRFYPVDEQMVKPESRLLTLHKFPEEWNLLPAFVGFIERFLSVAIFVPNGRRFLESDEALTLREPLAGLLKFGKAVCEAQSEVPAFGGNYLRSFEPKFDLNMPAAASAGMLRSRSGVKVNHTGRDTRRLHSLIPQGRHGRQRDSQRCTQR